jgi:hypothetical protein
VSVLDQDRAPPNDRRSQLNSWWLGGFASSDCSGVALASTLALASSVTVVENHWVGLGAGRSRSYHLRLGPRKLG